MVPAFYMPCVYIATNTVNGSIYIGKTMMGLPARVKTHFSKARNNPTDPFAYAIVKYGEDAFQWDVLYISDDEDALFAAEIELIASYRASGSRLYNVSAGGPGSARPPRTRSNKPRKMSDLAKERLRQSWTPERRAAQAEVMKARAVTDELRKKMSEGRKGMRFSPEHCEAIRASKLGNQCRLGTGKKVKPQPT